MRLPRLFRRAIERVTFRKEAVEEQKDFGIKRRWLSGTTDNRLNAEHWAKANEADTPISNDQAHLLKKQRVRAQFEIANNAMLAGVVETWVSDMLQKTGPKLRVKIPSDPVLAETIEKIWLSWWERPDFRGRCSGVEMLRTAFRGYWSAGEYFFQIVNDSSSPTIINGRRFTTKIQGIAPRRINDDSTISDKDVALGIRIDNAGRPLAYYVQDEDRFGAYAYSTGEYRAIRAADFVHDFVSLEPDQIRGVPWLAYNLGTIGELRDFDQQVLDAARLVASQTLYIYSDHAGLDPVLIDQGESVEVERNTMTVLPPGWKPFSLPATQPSNNYKEFRHERMRELGRFVGMPLLHIMLDSRDHNFATARLDRNMYRGQLVAHQDRVEYSTLDRFFFRIMREAGLLGAIPTVLPDDMIHEWIWPSLPEGDAKSGAQATTESLKNMSISLTEAISNRGRDEDDVFAEIAEEVQKLSALGLTHPAMQQQGASIQPQEEEPDEADNE